MEFEIQIWVLNFGREIEYTKIQKNEFTLHGCLGYIGCRSDCRMGALSIKTSVFFRKREYLKIRLIVCICSARFGNPTTSLYFLRWHCIYHKQPARQKTFSLLSSCMRIAISYFPSLDRGTASHNCLSTIIGTHGPKGFHVILREGYEWFLSAVLSSKGYWYYLFGLDDTSFSLAHLFDVSID